MGEDEDSDAGNIKDQELILVKSVFELTEIVSVLPTSKFIDGISASLTNIMRSLMIIKENVGTKVGAAIGHFAEKFKLEDIALLTKKTNFDLDGVKIIMTSKLIDFLAAFSSSAKSQTMLLESSVIDK